MTQFREGILHWSENRLSPLLFRGVPSFFLMILMILTQVSISTQAGAQNTAGLIQGSIPGPQGVRHITMNEAITHARAYHPQVQATERERLAAVALRRTAYDIDKTYVTGYGGQISTLRNDTYFILEQGIPWPGRFGARARYYDAQIRTASATSRVTQADLDREVRLTYIRLQALWEQHRLTQLRDSLRESFVAITLAREQAGQSSQIEVMITKAKAHEIDNDLEGEIIDIQSLEMRLGRLVGAEGPVKTADTTLSYPDGVFLPDSIGIKDGPRLELLQAQQNEAAANFRLEKSQGAPDFRIGYFNQSFLGQMQAGPRLLDLTVWNRFQGFELGLSILIWNKPQKARVQAAGLAESAARSRVEAEQLRQLTEVLRLRNELRKLALRLERYKTILVPQAAEFERTAKELYASGKANFADWSLALMQAQDYRQEYLDALLEYYETYIELQYLLGI